MSRRVLLALLAAMLLFAGAACSDSDTTTEAATDTEGEPATSDSDADGNQAEGTLRIAFNASTSSFDPHKSSSSFDIIRLALTYDRLLHTEPDGALVPGLATEWEWNEDATELSLTLREGVEFHDGTPFDADAVKANLERGKSLEGSTVAADLDSLETVEVVDSSHVRLLLGGPDSTIPATLSDRAGAMISPQAFDNPDLDVEPVGAGMFMVTEHRPDDVTIFEAADDYWDPEAVAVDRIEVYAMPDPVPRTNATLTGELDISPIEPADVERVQSASDIDVRLNETLRFIYLGLNKERGPLGDTDVRRAMSLAIDREALVEGIFFGLGTPAVQPWPEGYFPHNPDVSPEPSVYDPEMARELLAQAGYPDGFEFEVISTSAPETYVQLAESIQSQLAEIGVTMNIRVTEPTQLGQAYLVDQVADGALLYTNGRLDPAGTVAERYMPDGLFNPGGYSTDRLTELYDEVIAETDPELREELLQEISDEVVSEVLDLVLFHAIEPEAVSTQVTGYESYLNGKPEFRGVGVSE